MNKKNCHSVQGMGKNTDQRKCVIYTRTARPTEADGGDSLGEQEKLCREWAKKSNLDVLSVFSDGETLSLSTSRKGLDQMIKFLKQRDSGKKPVDFVLVTDMSRISRDFSVFLNIKREIESFDTKICFVDHGVKQGPEIELCQGITLLMKTYEQESQIRRIRRSMEAEKTNIERLSGLKGPYTSRSGHICHNRMRRAIKRGRILTKRPR